MPSKETAKLIMELYNEMCLNKITGNEQEAKEIKKQLEIIDKDFITFINNRS